MSRTIQDYGRVAQQSFHCRFLSKLARDANEGNCEQTSAPGEAKNKGEGGWGGEGIFPTPQSSRQRDGQNSGVEQREGKANHSWRRHQANL